MKAKINTLLFLLLLCVGINTKATQLIVSEASKCVHSMIDINYSNVLFIQDPDINQNNSKHINHSSIVTLNTQQLQLIKTSDVKASSKVIELIENVCINQVNSIAIKPGATTNKPNNKLQAGDCLTLDVINNRIQMMKQSKCLIE